MGLPETYESILARLHALRKRVKNLALVQGISTFCLVAVTAGTLAVLLETVFRLPSSGRYVLLTAVSAALSATFLWYVARPLLFRFFKKNTPDDISLALKVGTHFSSVRDKLADALQVFMQREQKDQLYSEELAGDSLKRVHSESRDLDFLRVASDEPARKALKLLAGVAATVLIIFVTFHSPFTAASQRLLNPAADFDRFRLSLRVEPGDAEVIKGESLQIRVVPSGPVSGPVELTVENAGANHSERPALTEKGDGSLVCTLSDIRQDKTYFVTSGDFSSDKYSISVVEKPLVKTLRIELQYPGYSRLGTQFLDENVGDISALPGTKASLFLETNKPVVSASVEFEGEPALPLQVSGFQATGSFKVEKALTYHLLLRDAADLTNQNPIEYRVSVIADREPFVQITYPGRDLDLNKNLVLPLTIEAEDDLGLSRLRLGYRVLQEGIDEGPLTYVAITMESQAADNALVNYLWDLSALDLKPEDVVSYYAEVFDTDLVSGPKSAVSSTFQARFPSIYEMYEEVESTHESAYEELEEIYQESKSLKDAVDEIVQEMKRDPELEWEEKQEIQEAAKAQAQAQEQLEEFQEALDEMVERMEQNDLLSPETLSKYQELQTLIQEMLTPEMREKLEELQESMAELDPQELQKAMQELSKSQEDFLQSMERTLNLLKKLQMEQQLDESIRKAQDLKRRQEELNQESEGGSKQDQSKYAEEQEDIKKDAEDLAQKLDELRKQMEELPQTPTEAVEAAQAQLQNEVSQKMQQAAQQFQSGQSQAAQQSGQEISEGLQQMAESLQQAKDQMSEEEKRKIMQAMRQSSHDLLNLSKRQEGLLEETKGSDRNTPGLRDAAQSQQDLISGLGRTTSQLYELSQNTFFVTPEIGKALGKAMSGMQESQNGLESRSPGKSAKSQQTAMSGLNEAVSGLRSSMQGLQGASSGVGFEEMMQRMMGVSNQQQGVNQQTSQMGEQGGLSMQQQAGMARLAAEQAAVRKSLEELMREAGKQSELLGDLGKVGEEMEEVVRELQRNNVNRSTIQRQKRILSRLLDAQRSMQDRDHSQKRKAEAGKSYETASPSQLPELRPSKQDQLHNELLRSLKENYSKDYKELIQKYFEALAQQQEAE